MFRRTKSQTAGMGEIGSILSESRAVAKSPAELERQDLDLSSDPEFLADFLKALFVEEISQVKAAESVTKADLAERLGKSRQ